MEGISRREAARRAGVNEATIRKHLANGDLAGALLSDGSLDAAKVERLAARTIQKGPVAPMALSSARNRRLRAQVGNLIDDVAASRANAITQADADAAMDEQRKVFADKVAGFAWTVGTEAAGKPASEAFATIRDSVHRVLERLSSPESDAPDSDEDPNDNEAPDLDVLSPNDLAARRINLQAEKMEIERALARGDMVLVDEAARDFDTRMATFKSLFTAIPASVANQAETLTPDDLEALVQIEVDQALEALR